MWVIMWVHWLFTGRSKTYRHNRDIVSSEAGPNKAHSVSTKSYKNNLSRKVEPTGLVPKNIGHVKSTGSPILDQ